MTVYLCALFAYLLVSVLDYLKTKKWSVYLLVLVVGGMAVIPFSRSRHSLHPASEERCLQMIEEEFASDLSAYEGNLLEQKIIRESIDAHRGNPSEMLNLCLRRPREYVNCVLFTKDSKACWLDHIGDH